MTMHNSNRAALKQSLRHRVGARLMITFSIALPLLGAGCEERVIGTSYGGYGNRPVDDANSFAKRPSRFASDGKQEYGIALAVFEQPNHRVIAEQFRNQLAAQTANASELWVANEGVKSVVYYGRYPSREDKKARDNLARWKQAYGSGQVRVGMVALTPIVEIDAGSMPQYALLQADKLGRYTFQIAVYDEQFGKDFRKAAEDAAATLRQDGYEAYYHHGEFRSMVTIGIFGDEIWQRRQTGNVADYELGPQIQQLQREFPYNLLNGRTVIVQQEVLVSGKTETERQGIPQQSMVVEIPGRELSSR